MKRILKEASAAGKFFEVCTIRHKDSDECLLRVVVIPIADSADGQPTAGIYLSSEDRDLNEIEKKTEYDFSAFQEYDRDFPFLLLARFVYDRGLQIIPDPAWQKNT